MKPTQEQAIAWAREAGVGKAFICAEPDECPDDDGCCHQNKQDGYWVRDDKFLAALTLAYEAGRKDERERILDMCKEGLWDGGGIKFHLDKQGETALQRLNKAAEDNGEEL